MHMHTIDDNRCYVSKLQFNSFWILSYQRVTKLTSPLLQWLKFVKKTKTKTTTEFKREKAALMTLLGTIKLLQKKEEEFLVLFSSSISSLIFLSPDRQNSHATYTWLNLPKIHDASSGISIGGRLIKHYSLQCIAASYLFPFWYHMHELPHLMNHWGEWDLTNSSSFSSCVLWQHQQKNTSLVLKCHIFTIYIE